MTLKSTHPMALSLLAILFLAAALFGERTRLRTALREVEQLFLAHLLMTTPSAETQETAFQDVTVEHEDKYYDDLGNYDHSDSTVEVAALAAFMDTNPWPYSRQVRSVSSSWQVGTPQLMGRSVRRQALDIMLPGGEAE